eukprot:GEZU01035726.1.p1 GENE.GEZU01035726.1~~GEZU01035726.1.p1  ORF type:complete len:189 (-),score=43.47 GEZU01035726.1:594-1160(-)
MSYYIDTELRVGQMIEFKGPMGGLIYQPNQFTQVGLIAGGSGIAPILQIINVVLGSNIGSSSNNKKDNVESPRAPNTIIVDKTQLSLIYAARDENELLFKDELQTCALRKPEQLKLCFTVEKPSPKWKQNVGHITEDMLKKQMPPPGNNVKIVICGPNRMVQAVEVILLGKLGYTKEMIYDFCDGVRM